MMFDHLHFKLTISELRPSADEDRVMWPKAPGQPSKWALSFFSSMKSFMKSPVDDL